MTIEPFQPEHLQQIELQAEQSLARVHLTNEAYARTLAAADSWTARIDGEVVACAGTITLWPGRHQAWALISATIGAQGMVQVTRAILRFLKAKPGRIEMVVAAEFEQGHRWARILGFTRETPQPMRRWFPEGGDAVQYSRIS